MKKLFKSLSVVLVAFVMVLGLSSNVYAADNTLVYSGKEEGFGFGGSEYTPTDFFHNFKGVMPGDELDENVSILNDASDCSEIKVYIKNIVHDENGNPLSPNVDLEEDNEVTMNDFLNQLTMTITSGGNTIYSGSAYIQGMNEYIYLGTLQKGESLDLNIHLSVPIELANEYAYRVGEVDWSFVSEAFTYETINVSKTWKGDNKKNRPTSVDVQLYKDGKEDEVIQLSQDNNWTYKFDHLSDEYEWTVKEINVDSNYNVSYKIKGDNVEIINKRKKGTNTGVQSNTGLYIGLLGISALVIIVLIVYRRKQNS